MTKRKDLEQFGLMFNHLKRYSEYMLIKAQLPEDHCRLMHNFLTQRTIRVYEHLCERINAVKCECTISKQDQEHYMIIYSCLNKKEQHKLI